MLTVRKSADRGHANHGWLDSHHTFSFAGYHDPNHMGFRALRVINEDRVAPGAGFPTHGHRDMEIISYVVEGALEHEDSMGTGSVIRPGEVQRMSAGTGVTHSEYNASNADKVRFLQIWVLPQQSGIKPSYEQKYFGDERNDRLRLVASQDGRDGSVTVHQDLSLFAAVLGANRSVTHRFQSGRHGWLQVIRGQLTVGAETLLAGDGAAVNGAAVSDTSELDIQALEASEFLLFDLA